MSIDSALVTLLGSLAGVTSIVGSNPMRVYPVRLMPNSTYPAMTYQRIDGQPQYSHSGYSDLVFARYQLTIWTARYQDGKTLELALKAKPPTGINGYRGTVGDTRIDRIFLIDGRTDYEPDTQTHMRTLDLMLHYAE